jgi:hypothetical protein
MYMAVAMTIIFFIIQTSKSLTGTEPTSLSFKENTINKPNPIFDQKTSAILSIMSKNHKQQSRFAYTTLLSGIDSSFKYRGFLYNLLIMKRALVQSGSTADFIALIGFSDPDISLFEADIQLLQEAGIIIHILPRFLNESHKLGFAEMALLKITPYSFTQVRVRVTD